MIIYAHPPSTYRNSIFTGIYEDNYIYMIIYAGLGKS